jgi:hypothetical protein
VSQAQSSGKIRNRLPQCKLAADHAKQDGEHETHARAILREKSRELANAAARCINPKVKPQLHPP